MRSTLNLYLYLNIKDLLVTKIITLLNEKSSKAMVQMPTGSRKNKNFAMNAITSWVGNNDPKFDGFVVWMAHTEELCEQAIESFDRTWFGKW